MAIEVMLDLETFSTGNEAAVVSIGAVKFNPRGEMGVFEDKVYINISAASLSEHGFHFDGKTVAWWMGDSEHSPKQEVRDRLFKDPDPVDVHIALFRFTEWFGAATLPTWGNGSDFDNVILRNAYRRFDAYPPWKYSDVRCFRTLKALFPDVEYIKPMQAHDALRDAEAQALHVQKLYNRIITK